MKNKIVYNIQVSTQEVLTSGQRLPYTCLLQTIEVNENLPFEHQIEIAKQLLIQVMNNLKEEHEKSH